MTLYSIGHSTRTFEELAALLTANGIRALADVRTVPASRRFPHFGRAALEAALKALPRPIAYRHFPGLGGLRKPRPDSPNAGWRVSGFRGYADYMQTPAFEAALGELLAAAREGPLAFMCAEAVPWRCHRNLLSDALVVRGHEVRHITGPAEPQAHALTPFAAVSGTRISYPPPEPAQGELFC